MRVDENVADASAAAAAAAAGVSRACSLSHSRTCQEGRGAGGGGEPNHALHAMALAVRPREKDGRNFYLRERFPMANLVSGWGLP